MGQQQAVLARFRRGAIEVLAVRIFGAAFLFLMHAVLIRAVGIGNYGVVSYSLAVGSILALVVPLGWPNTLLRLISQYQDERKWEHFSGVLRRSFQMTLCSSVVVSATLWMATHLLALTPEQSTGLRFAAITLPVTAFTLLRRKSFQALHHFKASVAFEEIALPVMVITGVFYFSASTADTVLAIYLVAACIVFMAGTGWLWHSLPLEVRHVRPIYHTRAWMAISLPILVGEIAFAMINRADLAILGTMSDMKTVGLYSAAVRLAALNAFVLTAVNTVATPLLASAYYSQDISLFRAITMNAMKWSALSALPLFVVMLVQPGLLLALFGAEAVEAAPMLRILAIGQYSHAALGPLGICLVMIGRERYFAGSVAIAAVLNISLLLIFVPRFGGIGAAWISTASFLLLNCWQFLVLKKAHIRTES